MDKPESLVELAARTLAPHLTRAEALVLPRECWEPLQRHLRWERQGEVFGESKRWHDNGQLRCHVRYKDGKEHGEYNRWYADGGLRSRKLYENGWAHGVYEGWFGDGDLMFRGSYRRGMLHGVFKEWHGNGKLKRHVLYENSVQIKDYLAEAT